MKAANLALPAAKTTQIQAAERAQGTHSVNAALTTLCQQVLYKAVMDIPSLKYESGNSVLIQAWNKALPRFYS